MKTLPLFVVLVACSTIPLSSTHAVDITVPELTLACGTLTGKGVALVIVNNRRTYFKLDCGKEHYL